MNLRAGLLFVVVILLLACQLTSLPLFAPASPTASRTLATVPSQNEPGSPPAPTQVIAPAPPTQVPPPQPVTGVATENLRVRALPSTNAAIIDRLNQGDTIQVVGRTAANDWLQIILPTNPNAQGWVSAAFVNISGALGNVPVVSPNVPPPPTQRRYP